MPHFAVPTSKRNFARLQRKNATSIEQRLWKALRARRCNGWKFRRQAPVGSYILDFVCLEARLVIEADGPMHDRPDIRQRDAQRDNWLRQNGFTILRITGDEIVGDLGMAMQRVEAALKQT